VASVVSGSIHTSGSTADPTTMTATDPGSMFHTKNFAKALGEIRSHVGPNARLDNFVVYPGYVSVTAVTPTGENDVTYYANGRFLQDNTGGSPGNDQLVSLSHIKPNIPALFASRIAHIGHMPLSQLHYLVAMIDPISGKGLVWMAYPVEGTSVEYWQAAGGTGPLLVETKTSTSGPQPVASG
jgi:hypothetical protein